MDGNCFTLPSRYGEPHFIRSTKYKSVLSAFDNETDEKVSLLKIEICNSRAAKRAYRELTLSNLFNHKNVVELLNAFPSENYKTELCDIFFVTKYMEYNFTSLNHILLPHDGISYLMYQALCGIYHLKKLGIIHGDLKPSNIGVNEKYELKILNFGSVSRDNEARMTNYICNRYYRAPEVILGIKYDSKIDIWALGCIFAELVLKKILFCGKTHIKQWEAIVEILGNPDAQYYATFPETIKSYLKKYSPLHHQKSWNEILPDSAFLQSHKIFTTENFRNLISQMLFIDPKKRIFVRNAIEHPYVKTWYKQSEVDDRVLAPNLMAPLPDLEDDLEKWKDVICDRIHTYFPNKE